MVNRSARALLAALLWAGVSAAAEPPPRNVASGRFVLPERAVWAGEIFDLKLVWRVDWQTFGNLDGPLEWKPEPVVAGPFSEPVLEQPGGGTAHIVLAARAMALAPGAVDLQPARQPMVLRTGILNAGDVPIAVTETRPVVSDGARLTVRPLPPAPPGFAGAVGRFTLTASAEPLRARIGEAVTWRLTLAGEGNWPLIRSLPARLVSRDFDIAGKPETVSETGASPFAGTLGETVTLIPRVPGPHRLGPVEMAVFDPEAGAYVTITAPAITLDVQPGPGSRQPAKIAVPPEKQAFPPAIAGSARVAAPLSPLAWRLGLLIPPLLVIAAWAALVWTRALRRDPGRPLRRAHRKLLKPNLDLREWQSAFAARHGITDAAPIPDSFADPDARALWRETETSLYAPGTPPLPADWRERMTQWITRLGPPPKFDLRTLLRRETLLPLAALFLVVLPNRPASADPLDWKARYTEARDAALDGRWAEAAPAAAAAWLQHPTAETAALWTLAARESGFVTDRGGVPLPPEGWRRIFTAQSPPGWQRTAILAAFAAAAGIILILTALYGPPRRRLRRTGIALLTVGAISGALSTTALDFYGPAGDADGIVLAHPVPLRPLPVDTPEIGLPVVPPGMAGAMDGAFLGWRHIRFGDGTTGWIRASAATPVWEPARQR